jgi:poly-gamma-glutamate synthesis protein (capsule biosynthesis protein)
VDEGVDEGLVQGIGADAHRARRRRHAREAAAIVVVLVLTAVGLVLAQRTGDDDATDLAVDRTTTSVPGASTAPTDPEGSSTAPASTAAPTTATTAPPAPGPDELELAFAGDVLTHLPLVERAAEYGAPAGARYDFGPMLAPMAPILEPVDLAICHLEVPLARDQAVITGYPSFGAPVELIAAIDAAGYDGCSTASNHSLDQGRVGLDATLDALDAAGLRHAGTARTAEEGAATTTYELDGATVAHLSYAYDFNGYRIPADAPFAANQIDPARIAADARTARERGAQLVVVSLHWGTEYRHEPSQYQRDVVAQLLPSDDIDVIVGHHAHVVQPIERIEGTYVVFGLGNQLANQPEVPRSDGLTVVLHARKGDDGRYEVEAIDAIPTFVDAGASYRVLPIGATLDGPDGGGALAGALAASYERTAAVIAGTPTEGVTLVGRAG